MRIGCNSEAWNKKEENIRQSADFGVKVCIKQMALKNVIQEGLKSMYNFQEYPCKL